MQSSRSVALNKFDQEDHKGDAYQAFQEFVTSYTYEYDAVSKDPPKDLEAAQKVAWIEQNKRKLFLGRYASSNLQRAFEEVTTETERSTITFADMITKLEAHFKTGSNTTLANFQFRKLHQKSDESFEVFANRVTHDSRNCDFTCTNVNCTVRSTLARDQIITGTSSEEIRTHALKNQWGLDDLIKNGRQIEAASSGVEKLKNSHHTEDPSSSKAYRAKRPGKYSNKNNKSFEKKSVPICVNCSSKACLGGKKCPGTKIECFDCGKRGHFRNAEACKKKKGKKKPARRVETDDGETSSSESTDSESPTGEESSSSSEDI